MQHSVEQLIPLLIKEIDKHKILLALGFTFISLGILLAGVFWPSKYVSFALVLSEEQNIINPLMEGRAATTSQKDRVAIAKEILFSQKIMDEVLREAGLIDDKTSPFVREKVAEDVQSSTDVSKVSGNLIRVEYRSSVPQRAYVIAKKFSEFFVEQSTEAKQKEATEAFNFIDNQVKEYHKKLTEAEQRLKEYRSDNVNATPGNEVEVNTRINALRLRIEQAQLELREAEIRLKSLEEQLTGEAEVTLAQSRENQFRTRIAELQTELDTLRLTYHDTYPDIVRIKHQIEDLKEAITNERRRAEQAKQNPRSGGSRVDEGMALSPLYQQLRTELSQTKTQVATLRSRISENQTLLSQELDRAKRIHGAEAAMAELTRDYNVNRDIYQDLLRRRENARVSMNLGVGQQGPTMKIQEPARLPVKPSGLRFLHFAIGGILLGIAVPLGLLYAYVLFDPRIRTGNVIIDKYKIPILASIPTLYSPREQQRVINATRVAIAIITVDLLIYIVVALLKLNRII